MPDQPWRDMKDPEQRREARKYFEHRAIEDLPGDVVKLFDENHRLRKENATQAKAILLLNTEIGKYHRSLLANWIATVVQVLALASALIKLFWLR